MLRRKVLIASMIITLLLAIIPMGISNATDTVDFKVSSVQGKNGEEVTISVDMQNKANFAASNMEFTYDDTKLEYVSYEKGSVLTEGANSALVNTKTSGKVKVGYTADPELTDQTKQAGNVLKVKLKIKDSVSGTANIGFACTVMKQKDGTNVPTSSATGTVTVTKALTSISLNKTSLNLNKDASETLTVEYNPSDTTDSKDVTWTSSNASVATVSAGKVTAVAPGKTTITAKVGDKTATCDVTVIAPLKSISLNKEKVSLVKGQSETLKVTYDPANTTDSKDVTWTSFII